MDDIQALTQLGADLTTIVVALALLFAERRSHEATRATLEDARREHLADLRQMAYSRYPFNNMEPASPRRWSDGVVTVQPPQ